MDPLYIALGALGLFLAAGSKGSTSTPAGGVKLSMSFQLFQWVTLIPSTVPDPIIGWNIPPPPGVTPGVGIWDKFGAGFEGFLTAGIPANVVAALNAAAAAKGLKPGPGGSLAMMWAGVPAGYAAWAFRPADNTLLEVNGYWCYGCPDVQIGPPHPGQALNPNAVGGLVGLYLDPSKVPPPPPGETPTSGGWAIKHPRLLVWRRGLGQPPAPDNDSDLTVHPYNVGTYSTLMGTTPPPAGVTTPELARLSAAIQAQGGATKTGSLHVASSGTQKSQASGHGVKQLGHNTGLLHL